MARREENECAWCAEIIDVEKRLVGCDWRVFCSSACVEAAEARSLQEKNRLQIAHFSTTHAQEVRSDSNLDSDRSGQPSAKADPACGKS